VKIKEYTALFLFCGLGGGALGFQQASARLFGHEARFRSVGGIDIDPAACADFEYLTGSPALCTDIARMSPAELRAFAGPVAPDVVFSSAPCKSFSGLTDPALARSPEYVAMARLYVTGVELLLSTWDVPPRLIILENVPRILSSGASLVAEVLEVLEAAGYQATISTHDCGELGGLAQRRRRALLVARYVRRCPALLYQPTRRPVRACGEVLGELPMPEDPAAGPMHRMPRISWLTWVRLALIPAGGDYRDLPGALQQLQQQRETGAADVAPGERFGGAFSVYGWDEATGTVVARPSAGGAPSVADPRVGLYDNNHQVQRWDAAGRTVIGATRPGSGAACVADPRAAGFSNSHVVAAWDSASRTVVAVGNRPIAGGPSVADPRVPFPGSCGVTPWGASAGTVTTGGRPSKGAFSVADPRAKWFDHAYRVLPWSDPSFTVHGQGNPGTGAYTVTDPRVTDGVEPLDCAPRAGAYGVLPWEEAARTITAAGQIDNGPFAVADPRRPEDPPAAIIDNPRRSPFVLVGKRRVNVPVVIIAEDGTWHRPMTPLELARLQDLPAFVNGAPLKLHGDNVGAWVERTGNAVPVGAARAIAEQMLLTLLAADVGAGLLPSGGLVWVERGAEVH
jgi:site-specific DNA-cytosine methylase